MKVNMSNVAFKSRFQVKGKDIDMENPNHMIALGYATAKSKNMEEVFCDLYKNETLNKSNYIFNIKNEDDAEFENLFNEAGLKFNKLA